MQKAVTLRDAAGMAGVSLGTPSRVINEHAAISPQNRAKVEEAIRQLNCSPNAITQLSGSLGHPHSPNTP
mgnify:FL=1|jgi:LacI family transcriptional regulator